MDSRLISALQSLLGEEQVHTATADRISYSYDNSRISVLPQAVLFPTSGEQVAEIVQLCRQYHTPITARGRGTATTGAAVPVENGIILSTEQMRTILRVDPDNRLMVVEPGVTNLEVQQAAAEFKFFWAPDPGSSSFCTVGGNIACGSAGPHAVKYGTVRENILGLKAIIGTGRAIRTGTETTKWAAGYDLTQLLTGSEGTLAIITEATLKLLPKQPQKRMMRALYLDMQHAADAVATVMAQPTTPCALEFMDQNSLELIRSRLGDDFPDTAGAMLMIELDGSEHTINEALPIIEQAATNNGLVDFRIATDRQETKRLWYARKILSPRLREIAPKKINEDIVVPVSSIPEVISFIQHLAERFQLKIANFGHAGNGNLHTNLLVNPDDAAEMERAEACLEELFTKVIALKGAISGEHGVGLVKLPFVEKQFNETERQLMAGIKQLFDPDGILNPGKGIR